MAKTNYTYDDFLQKAAKTGLLESFSTADLKLAMADPDAGMTLLTYKEDYQAASTDEARALANAGAERVRRSFGGYTGGADGSGYTPADDYVNSDAGPDTFAREAEALWEDYRKAYLREGQRAYEDSLGAAAANTGGIASTAAVTAAQQARNYYGAQAADRKAELYQAAYENWLSGRSQTAAELELQQKAAQQTFENAVTKWESYGYVTEDIAEILSLPAGTAYSQQAYDAWYQAYQEAANGIYTGKTLQDTVNAPARTGEGSANPAAGDSPANHATVSRGSTGADVTALQTYLIHLGYPCGDKGADGIFGSDTGAAVRAFQRDYGLTVDGIVGKKTWYAIFAAM